MQFIQNAVKNLSLRRAMSFYAVASGHKVGIYDTWKKCEEQVKGFKNAKYKKFPTREAAELYIKEINGAIKSGEKLFCPQQAAVPLGKKGPVHWNNDDVERNDEKPLEQRNYAKEFWPKSDDDNLEEQAITEAELLAAMNDIDENIQNPTVSSKNAVSSLKRKATDKCAGTSKLHKHVSKVWQPVDFKKIGTYEFLIDIEDYVIVYTDGSCINNGQANAHAGFGVYFGDNHPLNAAKPVQGRVTNNVGEIQAAIHAIKVAKSLNIEKLCISTDSQFLINAVTSWMVNWKRKKWCLKDGGPVKNVVDFKELDELLADDALQIKWNYVKAHMGIKGNEMADKLAREGSDIYMRLHSK